MSNAMKRFVFLPLAALSFMASVLVAAPAVVAQQATKIRFGNTSGIAFTTLIIAQEKGYFKKQNIDLEITNLTGSGPIAEALASHNLDMGNVAPTTAMLAISKGAKFRLISGLEYTLVAKSGRPWEAVSVVVRQGEGIKSLQDLRGKRIAVNDIGSIYNYLLRYHFKKFGFDLKRDLIVVPIPFSQMAGALVQKQVDAAAATYDGIYQARQRIPLDVVATHTSLEGIDIGLTSAVAVNNEFLSKNPDAVVRFLKAMLEAREWIDKAIVDSNPELLNTVAQVMKYSPERAKSFWENRGGYFGDDKPFINVLDVPERLMARQFEVLESADLLPAGKRYAYGDFVDISYLRKAYAELGMSWDAAKH